MNITVADYHVHTKASPDAEGSMEEYARKAEQKKIEVGFSDHIFLRRLGGYSDFLVNAMPAYVRDFLAFKEKVEMPVKLGHRGGLLSRHN